MIDIHFFRHSPSCEFCVLLRFYLDWRQRQVFAQETLVLLWSCEEESAGTWMFNNIEASTWYLFLHLVETEIAARYTESTSPPRWKRQATGAGWSPSIHRWNLSFHLLLSAGAVAHAGYVSPPPPPTFLVQAEMVTTCSEIPNGSKPGDGHAYA